MKGRDTIEIDHPPGEEIQWDWFERRRAPWGGTAYVLLGTLPHSGRVRGVLAEKMDQAHLIEAMDGVLRRLGGTPRVWRTDRLATVIVPGTRDVQATFAPVAKHYGAVVEPCPPRRGQPQRGGRVRGALRLGPLVAHHGGDQTPRRPSAPSTVFCAGTGDDRERRGPCGERTTVGELADAEPLARPAGAPFPATIRSSRVVADNATVAFRGNRYSVPPGLSGTTLLVRHRLGSPTIEVVAPSGALLVSHRLAPAGSGALVRSPEHKRPSRLPCSAPSPRPDRATKGQPATG